MATPNGNLGTDKAEGKGWGLCRLPFFGGAGGGGGAVGGSSSSSSNSSVALSLTQSRRPRSSCGGQPEGGARRNLGASSVSSVAKSLLPTRRRLRLDPTSKLYFPCESFLLVVRVAAFAGTFRCSFGFWSTKTIKEGSFSIFL